MESCADLDSQAQHGEALVSHLTGAHNRLMGTQAFVLLIYVFTIAVLSISINCLMRQQTSG